MTDVKPVICLDCGNTMVTAGVSWLRLESAPVDGQPGAIFKIRSRYEMAALCGHLLAGLRDPRGSSEPYLRSRASSPLTLSLTAVAEPMLTSSTIKAKTSIDLISQLQLWLAYLTRTTAFCSTPDDCDRFCLERTGDGASLSFEEGELSGERFAFTADQTDRFVRALLRGAAATVDATDDIACPVTRPGDGLTLCRAGNLRYQLWLDRDGRYVGSMRLTRVSMARLALDIAGLQRGNW